MKKILFTFFTLISISTFSQEICDNGVDDDADGLIDLNDTDCDCSGFGGSATVTSLIPNPSFEDYSCCPNSVSDLHCADTWIQASDATSDYFNTCGYTGIFNDPDLPLPGGGAGYGGFYSNQGWEENIGACLSSPMTAGTSYTLEMWTAWSTGSTTLDLTLYGTPNCGDLPWNTSDCSVGNGQWQVLGSTTVNYASNQSWQQITITFTPTVDIYAVSLGGPCGGMAGTNYYFLDELTLASSSSFSPGTITESGNWCTNDLMLTADPDTTGGTWQWYENGVALPGETSSTLDLMSYGAGSYTAVYTLNGDCIQIDHTVTLPPYPTSDFTFTNQCDGNAINFTDNSTITAPGTITNWDWDFGDGNTSTGQNPSHSYGSDGTYTVDLTVTDNNGCTHTSSQTVTIYPNPQADFEFVINGTSSASGLTGGCLVDQVSFVNNSTINTPDNITGWNWDFGDGNTSTAQNPPAHTYAAAGNYTIQLTTTSNNGCTNNYSLPITIHPSPTAAYTIPDECISLPAIFTDNSTIPSGTISTYEWDFGDGNTSNQQNPTHNYGSDGTYNTELVVISDQGCTDTATVSTTRYPEPTSDFTATTECLNTPTTLTNNSSVNAPDNITVWAWDFGDGNTSAVQNPGTHTYATEGSYTIELAVETNNGCQDTLQVPIDMYPEPVADFTVTSNCMQIAPTFTNNSTISSGSIDTWQWDFGDGNTDNVQNPNHTYASNGTYTVELIASTNNGCADTITQTTTQYPEPTADFSLTNECLYDATTINENSAVNAPDNITTWAWEMGDGNTGAVQNPGTHQYATHGTYTVELAVETNNGCQDTIQHQVEIYPVPQMDIHVTNECMDGVPTFTNNTSIATGSISTWNWDFGDGNSSNVQHPNHDYLTHGTYSVTLTATSDNGCVNDSTTQTVQHPMPTASFIVNDECVYDPITVNDNSTVATGNVVSWAWDFGDGNTGTGASNNNLYSTYGPYDIELTVVTDSGCVDDTIIPVEIHAEPIVDFQANTVCVNVPPTSFTSNGSSVPGGSIDTYDWDFGDGATGNGSSIDHIYGYSDDFNATLLVTSVFGCENSLTQTVTVYEKPQALFTSNKTEICSPDSISFTDLSSSATTTIDTWDWDFDGANGNGLISNPVVNYENNNADPAYFDVELIVTNGYGCKDTTYASEYITVYPTPKAIFTFNPQVLTEMDSKTQFNNSSIHAHSYQWDFGDNSGTSAMENPSHVYPNSGPGTYEVELIAYNYGQMCSDTAWSTVVVDEVVIFYVPNIFTPDGDEFNETWKPVFYSGHDPYDFHMTVFNRWGEIIWESYDATQGWDGHYGDGGLVEDGVYIWQVEFKETNNDKRHEHRGHVTVLK